MRWRVAIFVLCTRIGGGELAWGHEPMADERAPVPSESPFVEISVEGPRGFMLYENDHGSWDTGRCRTPPCTWTLNRGSQYYLAPKAGATLVPFSLPAAGASALVRAKVRPRYPVAGGLLVALGLLGIAGGAGGLAGMLASMESDRNGPNPADIAGILGMPIVIVLGLGVTIGGTIVLTRQRLEIEVTGRDSKAALPSREFP